MGCENCKQANVAASVSDSSDVIRDHSDSAGGKTLAVSPADSHEVQNFLRKVELFKRLPEALLPVLAASCMVTNYKSGEVIITQGDQGDTFYIIRQGAVYVLVDGNQVATLRDGDYLGEQALLRDEPRCATVKAKSNVQALIITRKIFREQGLHQKLHFAKRQAVGDGPRADKYADAQKQSSPKTPEERKLILKAIRENGNLKEFLPSNLDEKKYDGMIDGAFKLTVPASHEIIKEGDFEANHFYIVQEGTFEVAKYSAADQSMTDRIAMEKLKQIGPGGSFGELALLYFAPRAATVRSTTACTVWVIDRAGFKAMLAQTAGEATIAHVEYLTKVKVLESLTPKQRMEAAKALVDMTYSKDETIFEQGEQGESFFILVEGKVSVLQDGKEQAVLTGTPVKPEIFGEKALVGGEVRNATIKVCSDVAQALVMDKQSFEMLLGPLKELKDRKIEVQAPKEAAKVSGERAAHGEILRKDLSPLGLLGCGGFGAVEMVEHVVTKSTYALKALSKGYIVKSGMQTGVMREKDIQLLCDSAFIVKLYETYNGTQTLYFLLELALGGELYETYNRKGFHGSTKHAQFYISGTVLAFEHLHGKKIIFRDLKPENVLLTDTGHYKLTDMGLAKVSVGKTYTTCGTPDYFAPELIACTGHTNAVDWWTLGILTYELMAGYPPFESSSPMQIYTKVTRGINKIQFPSNLKGSCEGLVKALLEKDPASRLPMKKGGPTNVKNHEWFADFDFHAMEVLTVTPPYVPVVKNKKDIANFSASKEDMPPQLPYKDDGTDWDKDFATST